MNLLKILLLSGLVAITGCAADTTADAEADDEGEVATDDLTAVRKHHYAAITPEIVWEPGCGIQPPDGHVCQMGLFLTFTRKYIDLNVERTIRVDNTNKVITVKLDTWSYNRTHPLTLVAMLPQTERLDANTTQMGPYTTRVVDYRGRELFAGTAHMMPAP